MVLRRDAVRLALILVISLAGAVAAPAADLILILDASGSMWGQIEGQNKIVIAREVAGSLIDGLPDDQRIALLAYGHRREADCSDIELVTPLGPIDKEGLKATIKAIQPKGKTPITRSIEQAFAAIEGDAATSVILVSDGLETCDADPCAAVRLAKGQGLDFVLHVVGFDVAGEDVSSLECAAQAGDGVFYSAENAEQLASALDRAVALPADEPPGGLVVKVVKDGALHDASVVVTDLATGEEINGSRTYYTEDTNPRRVPLPAGEYAVLVRALGIEGETDRLFEITLAEGETIEKEFDFSAGTLLVGVMRNGELSDATINIFLAGTTTEVARGRSYTRASSNPDSYALTPGVYDVVARSVEIEGDVRLRIDNVRVEAAETVELEHEFASGTLRIGATRDGELFDATVQVVDADGNSVVSRRLYAQPANNPREFLLAPGTYRVNFRGRGLKSEPIEVVIVAGETIERMEEI